MHEREAKARAAKVARLAAACRAQGINAATAARLDAEGRDALAALHDVRRPSRTTWAQVVTTLEVEERRPVSRFPRGESTAEFMRRTDPVSFQQCRDAGRL